MPRQVLPVVPRRLRPVKHLDSHPLLLRRRLAPEESPELSVPALEHREELESRPVVHAEGADEGQLDAEAAVTAAALQAH